RGYVSSVELGCVVGVAGPHAYGDLGGEAHRAVVAVVVGRARLRAGRVRRAERRVLAEARNTGHLIRQDALHQVGVARVDGLRTLRHRVGIALDGHAVALDALDGVGGPVRAAGGDGGEGVGPFPPG